MARNGQRETLPQNTGTPVRNDVKDKWRNSVLVGPQTAGIPTVHNLDEWAFDSDGLPSNEDMVPNVGGQDQTGGAVDYHSSQRRR